MKEGPPKPYVYLYQLRIDQIYVGMKILNESCMCPGTIYGLVWGPGDKYMLQIHWNAKVTKHSQSEATHLILDTRHSKIIN